jgi:hypothetical protein
MQAAVHVASKRNLPRHTTGKLHAGGSAVQACCRILSSASPTCEVDDASVNILMPEEGCCLCCPHPAPRALWHEWCKNMSMTRHGGMVKNGTQQDTAPPS